MRALFLHNNGLHMRNSASIHSNNRILHIVTTSSAATWSWSCSHTEGESHFCLYVEIEVCNEEKRAVCLLIEPACSE